MGPRRPAPGARAVDVGCGPGARAHPARGDRRRPRGRGRRRGRRSRGGGDGPRRLWTRRAPSAPSVRRGARRGHGPAPGHFDVAVLRHVLAHNGGGEQAIVDHLARLVRPGGHVYLLDVDALSGSSRRPCPTPTTWSGATGAGTPTRATTCGSGGGWRRWPVPPVSRCRVPRLVRDRAGAARRARPGVGGAGGPRRVRARGPGRPRPLGVAHATMDGWESRPEYSARDVRLRRAGAASVRPSTSERSTAPTRAPTCA